MQVEKGDIVRIRKWKDMEKEYGVWGPDIDTPGQFFIEAMKRTCGKYFKVKKVKDEDNIRLEKAGGWSFTESMFSEVIKKERVHPLSKADELEIKVVFGDSVYPLHYKGSSRAVILEGISEESKPVELNVTVDFKELAKVLEKFVEGVLEKRYRIE